MRKTLIALSFVLILCATLSSCGLFGEKPCEHTYTDSVIAPTCTEDGYTEHTCSKCGETYTDTTVANLQHSYEVTVIAPTCIAEGYNEHTCSECGDSYKDVYTQKVIHPYKNVVVSPTCAEEGYTEHSCVVCGDSYRDATVPKLPHTYENETVNPTCTSEGYTKHTCSVCGDTYNDSTTAMTAHRFNGAPCIYCSMEEKCENITPDTEWYNADKIQFSISSAQQLAGLASLVNSGTDFTSQVIYLENDVDLEYYEWIPIGNAENSFKGVFDGKGHTISGLKINAAYSYVGLFGNVSGSITDFKVEDASVYLKDAYEHVSIACGYSTSAITDVSVSGFIDAEKSKYVGAVAGKISAQIFKVSSAAVVYGAEYVGGIAGYASLVSAILSEIDNTGEVTGGDYTGGLIGYLTASATLQTDIISNTGDVTGAAYVGGIFGYVNAKVGSSVYGATVSADTVGDYYVGGIVGKADNTSISTCSNEGSTVTANSYLTSGESFLAYLGGYVGAGYSVNNCINNVDILYNSRGMYVGGIAGYLVNTVTSCENNGMITGSSYIGGIVGTINATSALTVNNLKNCGDISGGYRIGGIIGSYSSTAATTLSNLENSGTITSVSSRVAGIIGCHDNGTATVTAANLKNTGDVVGEKGESGGLFGYITGSTSSVIKNSTSSANISGAYRVGGLVGTTTTVTIKECSNEGSTVTAIGWYTDGDTDYVWLGGYVGQGYIVQGCTNNSDITYDGFGIYVGGIAGYASGNIQNCTNNGDVTSKSSYVGGIVGYITTASNSFIYSNLLNTGSISGVDYISGIIGRIYQEIQKASLYENQYRHTCSYDGSKMYNHLYYNYTTLSNIENLGDVTASGKYAGGIIGNAYLNSVFEKSSKLQRHCDRDCWRNENYCYEYGGWFLIASNISNVGNVSGSSIVGELFGYVSVDASSKLDSYTVTGTITVNGETLQGIYDVGSNTNLTLSGREVYVPESPEENLEASENEEISESTEGRENN